VARPKLPLDRIHRWKVQQQKQLETVLRQRLQEKRKIEQEYADIRRSVDALARFPEKTVLADVEANSRYSRSLETKLADVGVRLEQAQRSWLEARGEYEHLTRELEVLSSVRDRQLERFALEEQNKWFAWLDDIQMVRWQPEQEA
jgi:hypothetical protein